MPMTQPLPRVPLHKPISGSRSQFWAHLRNTYGEIAPVWLDEGASAYLLLTYDINKQVLSDDVTYARDPRWWRELNDGTISRESVLYAMWHKRSIVSLSDGDEHRRLSKALHRSFSQLDAMAITGHIRHVAHDLIDDFPASGEVDLMSQYAQLLPLYVLCRIFNMDKEEVAQTITQTRLMWQGPPGALEAAQRLRSLLIDVATRARAHPTRALPSFLAEQGLTDTEVGDQLSFVISISANPAAHVIGMGLRQVLSDPELGQAQARTTLGIPETINLILARHTPLETMVARHPRWNVRLGGYDIRQGDCLVAGFAAASQDLYGDLSSEQVAANRAHLSFGTGMHQCPTYGSDLGKTMAETALEVVTSRLPELRLATPPEQHRWLPMAALRGLADLPAQFHPSSILARARPWRSGG